MNSLPLFQPGEFPIDISMFDLRSRLIANALVVNPNSNNSSLPTREDLERATFSIMVKESASSFSQTFLLFMRFQREEALTPKDSPGYFPPKSVRVSDSPKCLRHRVSQTLSLKLDLFGPAPRIVTGIGDVPLDPTQLKYFQSVLSPRNTPTQLEEKLKEVPVSQALKNGVLPQSGLGTFRMRLLALEKFFVR